MYLRLNYMYVKGSWLKFNNKRRIYVFYKVFLFRKGGSFGKANFQ